MFQVLVVYEDFAAGRRATDTCNLLMSKLGDEFELRCSMWKFEILRGASAVLRDARLPFLVARLDLLIQAGDDPAAIDVSQPRGKE